MLSLRRILFDIIVMVVIVITIIYVYRTYSDDIATFLFGDSVPTMYVKSVPIAVTIADEPAEHKQGLSGVTNLDEFAGKLFIYDKEGYYYMWMKDMRIPLDILWINNDMEIVHIEENLTPATYPDTFTSPEPARFVLEVNAFFTENFSIQEGDKVTLPPTELPADLIDMLQ